jgi:glycosyltransferase involved in cell wall biosynthesis
MKILYVCSSDLSGQVGSEGSVRHIMEVSENLCRLGHTVKLIAPGYERYRHPTPVKILYIPIINIRILRTVMAEFLSPLYIIAQFLLWRPVIVYWRQAYLTIFPVMITRLFGKDIVTEVNGLTIDELESEPLPPWRKRVILAFEWFNYHCSSHLICVAPQIRRRVLKHYHLAEKRVSVVLNGVNAERMPLVETAEAKREIGVDSKRLVVGFVGHLFPWDGVEYLIEAAPPIIAAIPDVAFVIVGHGQWGTHLEALAHERGVASSFIFTGRVPWERLYLYVNAFDIATAPYSKAINTQSGRSSLKILEYFACEKPVVASETDVIPEIVDLHTRELGITVQAEDSTALSDALLRLLKDDKLRKSMGQEGRRYVLTERSWGIVAQKVEETLMRVTA